MVSEEIRTGQSAEELLGEMRGKAENEKRAILAEAQAKAREIDERCRRECERLEAGALRDLEGELKAERDRVIGEVRAHERGERLSAKRELVAEVFREAERRIGDRIGGDGFEVVLGRLLLEGIAVVGTGARVEVAEQDVRACETLVEKSKIECTVHGTSVERGALRLSSADGRVRVNNSVMRRLERAREILSAEVARILFERSRPGG